MRLFAYAVAAALVVSLSLAGPAKAQPASPDAQGDLVQVALTDKQVQGFILVTPDINKITEKLQGDPDKKTLTQLDALAKKGGFASFDDYQTVAANIGMVIQGIDPQTKKFGDPKAAIQAQIAEVQADKKMKPAEKKEALEGLKQSLQEIQPIKYQGNIALVEANYDKLAPLVQD